MLTWIWWIIFFLHYSVISLENKTSSECWECKPNTPHVLDCSGSGVIVIHEAYFGYTRDCESGITDVGCNSTERERCCKPSDNNTSCFVKFNNSDKDNLEFECANKITCNFNSIKHEENVYCFSRYVNSFTRINYTCQDTESKEDGGTTAGIIIGVILVIIAVIVVIVFALRRKRQNDNLKHNTLVKESSIHLPNNIDNSVPGHQNFGIDGDKNPNDGYSQVGLKGSLFLRSHDGENNCNKMDSSEDTYNHIAEGTSKKMTSSKDTYNTIGMDNSQIKASSENTYNHIGLDKALSEDTYNHIGNADRIGSSDDTYNHISGDNSDKMASSDDTYNHIRGDNSMMIASPDDTYNHAKSDKQLGEDNYHHIVVNNIQQHDNGTDYNHIELADDNV